MSFPGTDGEVDVKRRTKRDSCSLREGAFTLIELLVVITVIAILMALLFPAFKGVQDQAKRTQAKNDVTQIVTAVNAFYTEYGQYPCGSQSGADSNDYFSNPSDGTQSKLFADLRGISGLTDPTINPKLISFIQLPFAKDPDHPRSGIGSKASDGKYYDPWGNAYLVKIDNNYNNQLENPYTADTGAGTMILNLGVIAWSIGKDNAGATASTNGVAKNAGTGDDDVISWQ